MSKPATTPQPRYLQIANDIANNIRAGVLGAGDQLPTERQLADEMGVSRMTVRQALALLSDQGLINTQHGIGNFVTRPMLEQPVDILVGFSENMLKKGIKPSARLLDLKSTSADQMLATEFQIPVGEPLFAIRRLRMADDMPAALEYSYFPQRYVPGLDHHDLEHLSIYAILANEYMITLEPVVALVYQARLLQIPAGALMLVTRTSTDIEGRVVEFAKDLYRGDCFRFVSHSKPPLA